VSDTLGIEPAAEEPRRTPAQRGPDHTRSICSCRPPQPKHEESGRYLCGICGEPLNTDTHGKVYRRWPGDIDAPIVGALAEIHEEMRDLVRQLPEREQRRLNEIAQLHPSRFEREAKAAIKKWEAIREHDSNPPVGPNTRRRLERQRDEIADAFDAREEKHG
jgi:hypothetical protein